MGVAEPRNGVGVLALQAGVAAVLLAFVPVIGDLIAVPTAVAAMVLGVLGYRRAEKGVATNATQALIGGFLGLAAVFVVLMMFFITSVGPGAVQ